MNLELISNSPDETLRIGKKIAGLLEGDELILLSGDLGAGKTLFTKGLAEALGIDPQQVVSPTFTLMNQYLGDFLFSHIDLYRIGESVSGSFPEVDEYLGNGIVVVEWAQYLSETYFRLPETIAVDIKVLPGEKRFFRISAVNREFPKRLQP